MGTNKIICFLLGVMLVASAWARETAIVNNVLGPEGPLYLNGNLYCVGWVSNTLSKRDWCNALATGQVSIYNAIACQPTLHQN